MTQYTRYQYSTVTIMGHSPDSSSRSAEKLAGSLSVYLYHTLACGSTKCNSQIPCEAGELDTRIAASTMRSRRGDAASRRSLSRFLTFLSSHLLSGKIYQLASKPGLVPANEAGNAPKTKPYLTQPVYRPDMPCLAPSQIPINLTYAPNVTRILN